MSIGLPISPMLPESFPVVPRRFTVEEYHRLAVLGVLTEDDRAELLEGVITPKITHNPPHDSVVSLLEQAIRRLIPTGWMMRIQSSLTTGDSEPEPDIAIVRGVPRDYMGRHPKGGDIGFVAEVSEASLSRDRMKIRLYARAGAPTYWIVNLIDGQIEAHSQPTGPTAAPAFQRVEVFRPGDAIPLQLDGVAIGSIAVADVLP